MGNLALSINEHRTIQSKSLKIKCTFTFRTIFETRIHFCAKVVTVCAQLSVVGVLSAADVTQANSHLTRPMSLFYCIEIACLKSISKVGHRGTVNHFRPNRPRLNRYQRWETGKKN